MKYNIKFLFVLVLACIASISAAAETLREYEIVDGPFMLHGKTLSFGERYTPETFEKKFGKSSGWDSYPPGDWDIDYFEEGISVYFTQNNYFKGVSLDMNVFNKLNIQGLIINKGDSYSSLRKKIEENKYSFSVLEYPKDKFILQVQFFTDTLDCVAKIFCSATGTQGVTQVFYLLEY